MKGTRLGAIVFFIMAGWTLFSDIFEYLTHLPVVLPTWIPDTVFIIVWNDYLLITGAAFVIELGIAGMLMNESRKPPIVQQEITHG